MVYFFHLAVLVLQLFYKVSYLGLVLIFVFYDFRNLMAKSLFAIQWILSLNYLI